VRRFRVKELQDYELEAIGAQLRGAEIREEFDIADYQADTLFEHLDEDKFRTLYSSKIDGCDHDFIDEMEPDDVQECLNEMVGKPVKIFDQGRCGICLEEERLFALSCGCAVFCQGCVSEYVKSSQKKCPICRKGFTLAECCQPTELHEFSEEGLEALLDAEDDRIRHCLDFISLAQGTTDTDDLIELAQESYSNYVEVEPEQAQADNAAGFANCGEEFATCGYYLCFEEIGDE
jgi:hypothetical protein